MKNNIESIKDVLEAQLSTPIPGTPFHAIKQEKRYLIVLGKNIVCEGVDIENNGVRETNADYRTEIDEIIRELLKAHPPKKLIEEI